MSVWVQVPEEASVWELCMELALVGDQIAVLGRELSVNS